MTLKSFKSVPDGRFHSLAVVAAMALVVGACGQQSDAPLNGADAARTKQDVNDASDPVLESALRDQIMVDPKLVQQANADALRPPAQPESLALPPETIADAAHKPVAGALRTAPAPSANCPQCASARRALTLGALAASQGGSADCVRNVRYSTSWANRLPDAVPLYPDARVIEAAGADGNGCALRVVSFASAAPMQRLLDWYYTRTTDAGYRGGHGQDAGEHVLAGTREAAAFMVRLRPRADGGTNVDLMVDAPR
ncbi:hypothetical protein SAMN05428950_101703 [Sphingomonas sp. OV641]|uniref:hypothetical protein n=1 Tax=Sphingomonas sp. OV641 TaxID=1881068 RepID=UPI0008D86901|nr:hypothetical protein [Sphingomonas sp. OV641]SEI96489.1 hypothetical protein SAMN05428950_101703 [Sphingomonas sp. OV641]